MSLLLAITLWFLIKKNVETPFRFEIGHSGASHELLQTPEFPKLNEPEMSLSKPTPPVDLTGRSPKLNIDNRHGPKN